MSPVELINPNPNPNPNRMSEILRRAPIAFDAISVPTKPTRRPFRSGISSIFFNKNPPFARVLSNPHIVSTNSAAGVDFREMGRLGCGFGAKGLNFLRFRAVSDGGSGGGDGGFRGWGDGGSGNGGGDGSGGDDWSFISWYLMALNNHPVMTKAITSALLNLIGDVICQILIEKVSKFNLKRTAIFTFLGLVLVGPTLHFWYLSLSKLVTLPGASGAFVRLLLDQLIFSPIFIGFFLSSLLTLEGKPSLILAMLQQEWVSSVVANWQLWIPFQFINFLFMPQHLQVLGANIVALAWNVILSFKSHKEVVLK